MCRCEMFNGLLRTYNLHGNRNAPSRDVTTRFAVVEHLHFLCHGCSFLDTIGERSYKVSRLISVCSHRLNTVSLFRCGDGLSHLLKSVEVKRFLSGEAAAIDEE